MKMDQSSSSRKSITIIGGNGKDVEFKAMKAAFCAFIRDLSKTLIQKGSSCNHGAELQKLRGVRITIFQEVGVGGLNLEAIKRFASHGDYDERDAFQRGAHVVPFRSTHSLVMYNNFNPNEFDADAALQRRLISQPMRIFFRNPASATTIRTIRTASQRTLIWPRT